MPALIDALVLFLLLLPAIILVLLMIHSAMPWLSKSWREAEEKAEKLVSALLSPEEYEQLRRRGYLDVPSPGYPQRTYRIPSGPGTVVVLEGGECIARLCVYCVDSIPEREVVIMHKLMIEGNEQEYLRTANHLPC